MLAGFGHLLPLWMLDSDWIGLEAVVKLLLQPRPAVVGGVSAEPPELRLTQQALPEPAVVLLLSLELVSQFESVPVVDSI